LDWMVCILLYLDLCTGHLIVNFKYTIARSVLISNDWHQAHLAERFGDGDASQIGLDLDEVISIYLALCAWCGLLKYKYCFKAPTYWFLRYSFVVKLWIEAQMSVCVCVCVCIV